jgi:phosphatidylinositol phospholipase C epsilon
MFALQVVSGQHVCPGQHAASPYIEVEIIGIMADCVKEKTKTVQRNAVNPIWQQNFSFRVNFLEFAFLRVAVCDSGSNGKCVAQRVIPLKCLRPGFRHVRLRTPSNLPLDQSTLFVRSRFEEEEHIYLHDEDGFMQSTSEQSIAFDLAKKQFDDSVCLNHYVW